MIHMGFAVSVLVLGMTVAFGGEAQTVERVLPNLCSGPPPDPLPPLRANRPSASVMAAHTRQHPYLFFSADERQALRDRAKTEPFRGLAERLRAHAEACLKRQIPPVRKTVDGVPQKLADGSYNPAWLRRNLESSPLDTYEVKEVITTLAFAYQLTGDARFGQAGKEWLLSIAARPRFVNDDMEADFGAGNVAFGLALGYDWLWELLSEPERQQVQHGLIRLAKPIVAAGKGILKDAKPDLHRGWWGNNHVTRTHGLFGLTPLALLYELPEAEEWLDMEVQLNRDRLYPSAWSPDGGDIDAWDHFDTTLDGPIPFLVALKQMGGEDLFSDPNLAPRFRGMPHFFLYGLEQRFGGWGPYYAWAALASHLRAPLAQWLATHDNGLQRIDDVFGYLFYDPEVKAAPPADPPGSVYWPYAGMVKMCSGWGPQGILIAFRCGPEIGKDMGDQNGFRLHAGGEWLLPRLPDAFRKSEQPIEFQWDLLGWVRGSPAQNVILPDPDGIGDFATYEKTGKIPLKGGIQFAQYPPMKGRQFDKQWLSGPGVPKNGDLRVVHFDEALDYVCGEAHRAYANIHPALWVRHILFVKEQKNGLPLTFSSATRRKPMTSRGRSRGSSTIAGPRRSRGAT